MADLDDLDSFFAEIDQVEAVVAAEVTAVASSNVVESAPVITSKTISRAPEITIKASNAVYTYDQPALLAYVPEEDYSYQNNETSYANQASYTAPPSSSSQYTYTGGGLSIAPTLTTVTRSVAPPQVPRSDKIFVRKAADETWVDESLQEWPENDYRIFVGDLAKEVNTEHLAKHFQQYKSFAKAKVIRTKFESKARGFGFVSFLDPMDCAKAIREQNGKYLQSRPMKITKSSWKDRDLKEVQKKDNKKRKMEQSLGLA